MLNFSFFIFHYLRSQGYAPLNHHKSFICYEDVTPTELEKDNGTQTTDQKYQMTIKKIRVIYVPLKISSYLLNIMIQNNSFFINFVISNVIEFEREKLIILNELKDSKKDKT